MGLQRRRI